MAKLPTMTDATPSRFLGESTLIETGHRDTVMLLAPFDVAAFDQDLFDQFGVTFPGKLSRAVDKRRADYLAGRALLMRAFEALNLAPQPVETGPDRAPIWPAGVTGSLSHSRTTCACILSTNTALRIGIDIETALSSTSTEAVRKVALIPSERALVAANPQSPDLPAQIFCAKETLFKALYPVVQEVFGFDSAQTIALPDETHIRLRLTRPLHPSLPAGAEFDIRHKRLPDQVLTWLIA